MRKIITLSVLLALTCITNAQLVIPNPYFADCGAVTTSFPNSTAQVIRHTVKKPDGKILSMGFDNINFKVLFAQYNADGSPDAAFGINGRAVINLGTPAICENFALQPDGKIVVVGTDVPDNSGSSQIPLIFRLNANGSVDNSFGLNGKTALRFDDLSSGSLTKVSVLSNGKIVAAGDSRSNANGGVGGLGIMKFNADGSLDNSFGNMPGFPGRSRFTRNYMGSVNLLVQNDEKIVLAYSNDVAGNGFPVNLEFVRFLADGTVDASFGTNGYLIAPGIDMEGTLSSAVQPDGKIIFSCTSNNESNISIPSKIIVLRYLPDFTSDLSFGNAGYTELANLDGSGISFYSTTTRLQEDGKILIGSGRALIYPDNLQVIIRLNSNGQPDASFNNAGYYFISALYQGSPFPTPTEVVPIDNNSWIVNSIVNFTLINLTANQPAPTAGALDFDGGDDQVELGNWFNREIFSIEMWLKPGIQLNANADIMDNAHGPALSWVIQQDGTNNNSYYLRITDNGVAGNTRWIYFTLTTDTWQHLAIVKDTAQVSIYVNGVLIASDEHTGNIIYNGSQFLRLGQGVNGGRAWKGSMDEVRIWNRPLCEGEIQHNMNCALGAGQNGLFAYYTFNQGFAGCNNTGLTSLTDAGGNERNGSLLNFALTGSSSNWLGGNVTGSCSPFVMTTWYTDADGDGYGTGTGQPFCANPGQGYAAQAGDCNDGDTDIHPGAAEVCGNGIDDNCNGQTDEGCIVFKRLYRSIQSGNWNDAATWEVSQDQGHTWTGASAAPNVADSTIQIRAAHHVTIPVNTVVTADEIITDGSLQIIGNLVVNNGQGIDLLNNGDVSADGNMEGPGQIQNNGTITHNSGEINIRNLALTSTGTIQVSGGSLNIDMSQVINTGAVSIAAGAVLFTTGTTTFKINNGSVISGSGLWRNAGIAEFNTPIRLPNTLQYEQTDGQTGGSATLNIAGIMNWKDGPVAIPVTIDAGATLNVSSNSRFLRSILTINGTMNWGNAAIRFQNGIVRNYGQVNAVNTVSRELENVSGTNGFYNYGDYVKNGAGNVVIGIPFTNTGTVKGNGSISFPNNNLINNGTIAPGLSPGILSLNQSPFSLSSTLSIEILDASGAGTGYDRLDLTTDVVLNGVLQITGPPAVPNGNYTILTSTGNITGNFSSTQLPAGYSLAINGSDVIITKSPVTDICNGLDDDNDGQVDEDAVFMNYYRDADGDGYGNAAVFVSACQPQTGYVSNNTDCNDDNAGIHPNATEVCNGIDDDCDGLIDESETIPVVSASGSTTFCAGGAVTLSAPLGTSYLWSNGAVTQTIPITESGSYTVTVTNAGGCTGVSQAIVVVVHSLPAPFTITSTGALCNSGSPVLIRLPGSQTGVNYQLIRNGNTNAGNAVAGTGAVISFGNQTIAGTYTITATNAITNCASVMNGSITIAATPTPFTLTGGGRYCSGGNGVVVGLASSQTGVLYQLRASGNNTGSPVPGTSGAISFGNQTTAGNYTVQATNAVTGCTALMTGSVNITISTLPNATITASGSTSFCAGGTVRLTATQASSYLWSNNATTRSIDVAAGGNYAVAVTNQNGCTAVSAPVSVTVNVLPLVFTITGGGSYCSGGTGLPVGLNNSQTGISYQLKRGNANAGTSVAGTGSAISFGNQTTAGTYTIFATNTTTNCGATMSGSITVSTTPLPARFNVNGGGSYCTGGSGVVVDLANSQAGVLYQLIVSGNNTGVPVAGTGSAISFGNQTIAGIYTVQATNILTGCSSLMQGSSTVAIASLPVVTIAASGPTTLCAGSTVRLTASQGSSYVWSNNATARNIDVIQSGSYTVSVTNQNGCSATSAPTIVTVNAAPLAFTVTGGGSYCVGSVGLPVGLNNSQTGVSYQLRRGNANAGTAVAGTGSTISFGNQTTGTYTVTAINTITNCSAMMNGSITISTTPLPARFNVNGGGSYCTGGSGVVVGLANSQTGVLYQLMLSGNNTAARVAGTDTAISFGNQTTAGVYTVQATNTSTGCTTLMQGSSAITIDPLPVVTIAAAGPTSFCAGGTVRLTASPGSSYRWSNNATSRSIDITQAGSYTVTVTNQNGCVAASAPILATVLASPLAYAVTGGGTYCSNLGGLPVGLANSQTGINYQLMLSGNTNPIITKAGTGTAISFGNQRSERTYSVIAIDTSTNCATLMNGSVRVLPLSTPMQFNLTGGGLYCNGKSGSAINLSGSETGVFYQLRLVSGSNIGQSVAGTGTNISFGIQTTEGLYEVQATNIITGCTRLMIGNIYVGVYPVPNVFISSANFEPTTFCAGGSVTLIANPQSRRYSWSSGGASRNIDVNQSGAYTVTVTDQNGCATTSAPTVITVVPPPVQYTVTGGGNYCYFAGNPVPVGLSNSQSGVNYQLSLNGYNIGTAIAGTGVPVSFGNQTLPGSYLVKATNALEGCQLNMTGYATISVTYNQVISSGTIQDVYGVYPQGAINTIYAGYGISSATLLPRLNFVGNTGHAAAAYRWTLGSPTGPLLGTNSSLIVSPATTSSYYLNVSDPNSCSNITISKTIQVVNVRCGPNSNSVIVCNPATNTTTCAAQNQVANLLQNGYYLGQCSSPVTRSAQNNFDAESANAQPAQHVITGDVVVYPNPANHQVNLRLTDKLTSGNISIQLVDGTGRLIQQWVQNYGGKSATLVLNTSSITNGFYILAIKDRTRRMISEKLVIQH